MSRILQITAFPTVVPVHSEQRRAHQIGLALQRAGHDVHHVAAYSFAGYGTPPSEPAVDLGRFSPPRQPTTWQFDGVRAMEKDANAFGAFATLCERAKPELILIEEVWLWPVVRRLPMVASGAVSIIYNSYNIAAPQFRSQLMRLGHPLAEPLTAELSALEADVARRAHGCSAVTEEDAAVLRSVGGSPVVVAPNGVSSRKRNQLVGALPEALDPEQRYVLYVASARPGNASGIPELFTAMLEALRPLERLVVAGGVCRLLDEWLRNGGPADLARGRLILMWTVSDLCLDALITNAKGFVLPLRECGGSNRKIAEALYSGLPLVATTMAMRNYEAFRQMDGVILVDDVAGFATAMRDILEMRLPHRSSGPALDALLWVNTLRPIVQLVATVLAEHTAPQSV